MPLRRTNASLVYRLANELRRRPIANALRLRIKARAIAPQERGHDAVMPQASFGALSITGADSEAGIAL